MTKLKLAIASFVPIGITLLGLSVAAQQASERKRAFPIREPRTDVTKSKAQPPLKPRTAYVVEPPDLVIVEVLEALAGRPISGERLVRPDGTISLGFYGDLSVEGLTLPEIKEKIVLHLRKYLIDETLGLIKIDPETDQPAVDPKTKQPVLIDPRDTDRVFVDVTAYNSRVYYVQGAVREPCRMPVTGNERVLDAINLAGGLMSNADHSGVILYHKGKKGEPLKAFPIDIDQITMGDDLSTNYQLEPGDRLVVRPRSDLKSQAEPIDAPRQERNGEKREVDLYFNRQLKPVDQPAKVGPKQEKAGVESGTKRGLEDRIEAIEHKLDAILDALKKPAR